MLRGLAAPLTMPPGRRRNLRTTLLPRLAGAVRRLPPGAALGARPLLSALLAAVPGWTPRLEAGMRAALGPDGYRREHVRAYFSHLADLVAYSAVIFRSGIENSGLEREIEMDAASVERYREALRRGKGVLMACPHLVIHELAAGFAGKISPVTALVRKSPDAEYEAIKQQWYAALGLRTVYRPPKDEQGLGDMVTAIRTLRKNGVLAISPDVFRKPGTGVPVQLFGRTVDLPAGPFFLAARAGAPLLPVFLHHEAGRYRLWSHAPLEIDAGEDRDAVVALAAQRWTDLFEAFLREHPDMWQFWLDKRWSQWLQGSGAGARPAEAETGPS